MSVIVKLWWQTAVFVVMVVLCNVARVALRMQRMQQSSTSASAGQKQTSARASAGAGAGAGAGGVEVEMPHTSMPHTSIPHTSIEARRQSQGHERFNSSADAGVGSHAFQDNPGNPAGVGAAAAASHTNDDATTPYRLMKGGE